MVDFPVHARTCGRMWSTFRPGLSRQHWKPTGGILRHYRTPQALSDTLTAPGGAQWRL